jgi:hypothetical protein
MRKRRKKMANKEKLQEIDGEFRKKYGSNYMPDGIYKDNFDAFNSAKYKILWVLKEAHSDGGDLAEYFGTLTTKSKDWNKTTHRNMMRASYGILNSIYEFSKIPAPEKIVSIMKEIAIINVKKIGGDNKADDAEISKYLNSDIELLRQQIDAISPNIIIGGNTLNYLSFLGFKKLETRDLIGVEGHHYFMSSDKLYISANHPAYISDESIYVNGILDAVKDWEETFKNK